MAEQIDYNKWVFKQDWEAGHSYDLDLVREQLIPVIDQMHLDGELGWVVADVGSGKYGVSSELNYPDVKIVRVDLVAPTEETDSSRQFPADLRQTGSLPFGTRRELLKTQNWLAGKGLETAGRQPNVDTIILSAVLNYVPYKKVLSDLSKYLKPSGRLIIFNQPQKGRATHGKAFNEDGSKGNLDITGFVEKDLNFKIEQCKFDGIDMNNLEESIKQGDKDAVNIVNQGYLLLVARKSEV